MIRFKLFAAVALVAVLASCGTGAGPVVAKSEASLDRSSTTTTAGATVDTTVALAAEPAMVTTTVLDAEMESAIAELIALTEELRELTFDRPPLITVVTPDELAERVRLLIEEELVPDELARDQALLASLGVLPDGVDLGDLYLALYAEQVQGYYDGETGELVVPSSGDGMDVLDKMVLVHELTHALTDQAFGFHSRLEVLVDANEYETSAALRALVEGDATYTQALYFWQLPGDEQIEGMALIDEGVADALAQTPSYIVDLLQFPYNEGARFVTALGKQGGFEALDSAYRNPPTTTEQIYDLGLFESAEPGITIDLSELDLDGYRLADSGVWGRAGLEALFEPSLGRSARLAAEGWGGDRYQVYFDDEQTVFVMVAIGDTEFETDELFEGWLSFVSAQVPSTTAATVGWTVTGQVAVVLSPDAAAMKQAVRALDIRPAK